MGFLACAGYTLVGAGPPAAIFYEFIVSSPFVLLVSLASAFFWVTVLLANSVVWRSLSWMTRQGQTEALRVLPLISFFATEELLRPMVFRQTKRATAALERRAVALRHPRLTKLERVRIFLGIGAGQGVAHSCLFFLNTVVTSYRGTYYNQDTCPQMPYFLVAAISTCAMFMVLSFAMVLTSVVFESAQAGPTMSTSRGGDLRKLLPCALHAAAVLISFLNMAKGGCLVSSVLNALLVGAVVWMAARLVRDLARGVQ